MIAEHAPDADPQIAATHTSSTPKTRALTVAALGVVFGDIGTSPLYAFKQCFTSAQGVALNELNVLGILSLIIWSLILVISLKYVVVMLRADNHGEGGILALSMLVGGANRNCKLWQPVSVIGILGAALFLGDGMLTPAISVLSAVEGLTVATPHSTLCSSYRLLSAFWRHFFTYKKLAPKKSVASSGRSSLLGLLLWRYWDLSRYCNAPSVLAAFNPMYAVRFFAANAMQGFLVLSAVFLCVTGGEALYADLGHFGRVPIRNAWFLLVLPALVINYLGQGALVLQHPEAIRSPFYLLSPEWLLVPLIVLATAATIIASQAVISGVFSVITQAMNLGYLPRLRVLQSSASSIGQVYVPAGNWILFIGTAVLVLGFRSSDSLAGAYGIAVSTTMLMAGLLVLLVPMVVPGVPRWLLLPMLATYLHRRSGFFLFNIIRVVDNGWVPIVLAAVVFVIMSTWSEGRRLLNWNISRQRMTLGQFHHTLSKQPLERAAGTAVYLSNEASIIPVTLSSSS